jgi:hypothetical protein
MKPGPFCLNRACVANMLTASLAAFAVVASTITVPAQVFPTVGVYDEPTQTNAVDFVATGSTLDFNQFKSDVAAAFTNNFGGVNQCELIGNSTGPYAFSYGASQTKLLRLTGDTNTNIGITSSGLFVQSISLSSLWISLNPEMTFFFKDNPIGLTNEPVIRFGLTILSTSFIHTGTVTATARFSGGGQASASRNLSESSGLGDTFFGFAAPSGQSIVSVTFTNSAGQAMYFDDVAFITDFIPILNIQVTGGFQVRIGWPTNATGYVLVSATNLPASTWTGVTNVPTVNGKQFVVTLPSAGGHMFFRLRRP